MLIWAVGAGWSVRWGCVGGVGRILDDGVAGWSVSICAGSCRGRNLWCCVFGERESVAAELVCTGLARKAGDQARVFGCAVHLFDPVLVHIRCEVGVDVHGGLLIDVSSVWLYAYYSTPQ